MKIKKSILVLLILNVSLWALIDVEEEINAPVAQMKMMDDAMNKAIKEQRERNARKMMSIEDEMVFHETPIAEFILQGDSYILEKSVQDINNTTIKTKLENRMLTITEIRKIEEVVIEDALSVGTTNTQKKFFESTTSETLSLPQDADEKTFLSHYENGVLKVILKKKKNK